MLLVFPCGDDLVIMEYLLDLLRYRRRRPLRDLGAR